MDYFLHSDCLTWNFLDHNSIVKISRNTISARNDVIFYWRKSGLTLFRRMAYCIIIISDGHFGKEKPTFSKNNVGLRISSKDIVLRIDDARK